MKYLFILFCLFAFKASSSNPSDSLKLYLEIDTLKSYSRDSCFAKILIYRDSALLHERYAYLTWYRFRISKERRKEKNIKFKYGYDLEVTYHGVQKLFLKDGTIIESKYIMGECISPSIYDVKLNETIIDPETGAIKLVCRMEIDLVKMLIISQYGVPGKVKNKRYSSW